MRTISGSAATAARVGTTIAVLALTLREKYEASINSIAKGVNRYMDHLRVSKV